MGITTFGSGSDFVLRFALEKNGLDPNKDVSIMQMAKFAKRMQRVPRVSLRGVQSLMERSFDGGKQELKPERVVDNSIVDELERNGFIDSVYK